VVGSGTRRWQSACAALRADMVELVVKTCMGKRGMTAFYRGGDVVVGRGGGWLGGGGALSRGGRLRERRRED
jgi:hypothetical protein